MSESPEEDNPPEPFSALSFESAADPGTLSLSDSDPALSDDAEVASVSSEEEDDDEQDAQQESTQKASVQPFTLKGTDTGFSRRSFDIFGGLLDVQKSSPLAKRNIKGKQGLAATSVCETPQVPASDSSEQEATTKPSSTDRSALVTTKRSAAAARLPDYLAHPERWTKYSLEDVPDSSDRTNRNTALSFLTQLKHQKESKEVSKESAPLSYNQDSSSSAEGRILFTKPKKGQKEAEKSEVQGGQIRVAEKWADDGLEDAEELDQAETGSLGFHGIKKRSRKNIRQKADDEEEEAL